MPEPLTLFVNEHLDSPYGFSAFVALEEKKLPYELKTFDASKLPAGYRTYSRTGRVPSLQHGDYRLSESSAIAEYLAETFPFPQHPRIFPEDLRERGICRMVQAWVRSDFMSIREERSAETIFLGARTEAPLSKDALQQVDRLLGGVEPLIGDRPTLFAQWCIADADLALMLQRLNLNGGGYSLPPKVKAYTEAAWQRPSVQKWVNLSRPVR